MDSYKIGQEAEKIAKASDDERTRLLAMLVKVLADIDGRLEQIELGLDQAAEKVGKAIRDSAPN